MNGCVRSVFEGLMGVKQHSFDYPGSRFPSRMLDIFNEMITAMHLLVLLMFWLMGLYSMTVLARTPRYPSYQVDI